LDVDKCFYGAVTVGERGQVVIPAEARSDMGIKPGDKILILKHPVYDGLVMAKLEAFSGFLEDFAQTLEKVRQMAGEE
jgi:AbrB family looped-hinge helix DNA binding protein